MATLDDRDPDAYDDCWLRYPPADDARRAAYRRLCAHAYVSDRAPELGVVREELRRGLGGLLDREPHVWQHPPRSVEGFLAVGRHHEMAPVRAAVDADELDAMDEEGYLLRTVEWEGADCLVCTAPTDRGLVYGTFALLRRLALGTPVADLDVVSEPAYDHRVVNLWDDPFSGAVERGYAGRSIFDWDRLPDRRGRYRDYARLLASVGINGIALNNVNTQRPDRPGGNAAVAEREGWQLLAPEHTDRIGALADTFRPYGIETYLSVDFAAPILVGGLDTADPLDDAVADWWADVADRLCERIPDFGGFLVKADSEGQPGPYDYGRDHAEGANVLARALAPHGGRVFWRAFVYADHDDRAVEAGETFRPLDGAFDENVTLQVKNGPIDFQPREPVTPLFGSMPATNLACELQITGEYTGQAVHCCYHVPQWREVLAFDTHADGRGTPVRDLLAGEGQGAAGVAGVGDDPTWTGHHLAAANLHGFGRLLWDPSLDAEALAGEWARLTFPDGPAGAIAGILLDSYPAVVDYETGGLGLIHMMYNGNDVLENHYDPAPREWPEYTGAGPDGIGVDRTASGSGYVSQYADPVAERYADPDSCPDDLLLFFHRLPWEHELADGTTVVQRLYDNCFAGAAAARELRDRWAALDGVDDRRHRHVAERFDEQAHQAERWRDALVDFFHEHSGVPDERGRVPRESGD